MEWTVVTVIVALVGLGAAVIRPIVSLTRSITELTGAVRTLREDVSDLNAKSSKVHERLWRYNEGQDRTLHDHEKRIGCLESR